MTDSSFLRDFTGVDGVPPTARQLERALTLLGYDLAYEDEQALTVSYLAGFVQRHGPLSINTVATVARRFAPIAEPDKDAGGDAVDQAAVYEAKTLEEKDILFALTTLGALPMPEAPSLLLPYLGSLRAQERWLAAFGLAALHDERALPAVERMLVEFVGPHQPKEIYIFQLWREWLLQLLAEWGDSRLVPCIRAGLIATVRAEEAEVPEPSGPEQEFLHMRRRYTGPDAWEQFDSEQREWIEVEHQLVYALGRLNAFGALGGVPTRPGIYSWMTRRKQMDADHQSDTSEFRKNIWRVHACLGALEKQFAGQTPMTYTFAGVPDLTQAIVELLEGQFGLDQAGRHQAMEDYERAGYIYHMLSYYEWIAEQVQGEAEEHASGR